MTLDEAIKYAEEVVEEQKELYRLCPASESGMFHCDGTKDCRVLQNGKNKGCRKLAEEHLQLAEWLKNYKWLKEQEPCKVSEYDKDHIWYKGSQYISLRRFLEVKAEKQNKWIDAEVLNKIRAEIKEKYDSEATNHDSFDDYSEGRYDAYSDCLRIIDNYKASPTGDRK